MASVPSVEPSSMTISSKSWKVCAHTESIALEINCARFKVGMISLTRGIGESSIDWKNNPQGRMSENVFFNRLIFNLEISKKDS